MLAIVVLGVSALPPVELRPTGERISLPLLAISEEEAKPRAVFVAGRDTGLRVPTGADVTVVARRGGLVVGTIETTVSGGITSFSDRAFLWKPGRRARVLPVPRGYTDAWAFDLDGKGRVLLAASGGIPFQQIQDPFSGVVHAFIWDEGRFTGVGPADRAHFEPSGAVSGRFTVDSQGRAINRTTQATATLPAAFVWSAGRRTETKPKRTR